MGGELNFFYSEFQYSQFYSLSGNKMFYYKQNLMKLSAE